MLDDHESVNCVASVVSKTKPIAEEEVSKEDAHVVAQLVILSHKVQEGLLLAENVDRDEFDYRFAHTPVSIPASACQVS